MTLTYDNSDLTEIDQPLAIDHYSGLTLALCSTMRRCLQDVVAPFVLDNLNCTGGEERLVDCPGATLPDPVADYGLLYTALSIVGSCDPLQGTYAFVACGTLTGPGAFLHVYHVVQPASDHFLMRWRALYP